MVKEYTTVGIQRKGMLENDKENMRGGKETDYMVRST